MSNPTTENERVAMAHYAALKVAVTALLETTSQPNIVRANMEAHGEGVRTQLLTLPWGDQNLDDFERALAALLQTLPR